MNFHEFGTFTSKPKNLDQFALLAAILEDFTITGKKVFQSLASIRL